MPRTKRSRRIYKKTKKEREIDREKRRIRRLTMTEEQREVERERARIRRLKRKLVMTEEERKIENQKVRDKRFRQSQKKTEEERKEKLEKARLATRIARALQTPEEREKRLKRERENRAMRRLQQKQNLKLQSTEIPLRNVEQQPSFNLPTVVDTTPEIPRHDYAQGQEDQEFPEVRVKVELIEEIPIDAESLSDFTFQVAEGLLDPRSIFEEENSQASQTIVKEEPAEEFSGDSDSTEGSESEEETGKSSYFSGHHRTTRLSALKARAKLAKLRVQGTGEDAEERVERLAKITKKKKMIHRLNAKCSEEDSRDVQTAQRKRSDELMITKLVDAPLEKKIAGIAELIKKKNIPLTGETPEQRAARIIEDLKREKGSRKSDSPENTAEKRKKRAERSLQNLKARRSLETPEEQVQRKATRAAQTRNKNRMEREEFQIYQLMMSSENPVETFWKDTTTPDLLKLYEFFRSREKKVPEFLQEWRKMLSRFSQEILQADKSEVNQAERYTQQNNELKQWLLVHGEVLKDFLLKRKDKMNVYYRNLRNNPKRILSDEEKKAARRKINENKRKLYRKNKEKFGFVINARGERGNTAKKSEIKTNKRKGERKSRRMKGLSEPQGNVIYSSYLQYQILK